MRILEPCSEHRQLRFGRSIQNLVEFWLKNFLEKVCVGPGCQVFPKRCSASRTLLERGMSRFLKYATRLHYLSLQSEDCFWYPSRVVAAQPLESELTGACLRFWSKQFLSRKLSISVESQLSF